MWLGLMPSTSLSFLTRVLNWTESLLAGLGAGLVSPGASWLPPLTPLSRLPLLPPAQAASWGGGWAKFILLVLSLAHLTQAVVEVVLSSI